MRDYCYDTQEFKETGEDPGETSGSTKVINHLTNYRTNGTNNDYSAIPSNGSRSGANNKHRGDHYRR